MSNDTNREELSAPKGGAFAVTPSDTVNFTQGAAALYVGVGGTVVVVTAKNQVVNFVGVGSGSILPVRCQRVNASGTTATNIVGLY
jgi:hypothetical protein